MKSYRTLRVIFHFSLFTFSLYIMLDNNAKVLLIYTGGTIGMIENPRTGVLESFDFNHLQKHVPELKRFRFRIDNIQFDPPIDSSDMELSGWRKLVRIIEENYERYDGFVILHGTDTMAYTASALSFMLENLRKPVILTGSQLPIGKLRTDGKENLITALEIAVDKDSAGSALVPEVCIFFQNNLFRGNRTTKIHAENFKAFNSFNYPTLAEAGIHIKYERSLILPLVPDKAFRVHYLLDPNVVVLTLFPGISPHIVKTVLSIPELRGVVMKSYGMGNSPGQPWLLETLREAVDRGVVIVNITQCASGTVIMDRYLSGSRLLEAGIIPGHDMTTEAAVTKLMFLLGHEKETEQVKLRMAQSVAGEVTLAGP